MKLLVKIKKLGEIKNILITNGYYISDIDKENILAKK